MTTVRVHEIAKRAGTTTADIIARLDDMGHRVKSASSSVPADVADVVVSTPTPPPPTGPAGAGPDPDQRSAAPGAPLHALVAAAFDAARATKPDGWRTMTTAVLKNRLLQLSGGSFSERAHGFSNMTELALSLPDLLQVDERQRPVSVTLRDGPRAEGAGVEIGPRVRVRPDLWTAVMDYSAGVLWTWVDGRAVAAPHGGTDAPVLPTMTPGALQEWRDEFAADAAPTATAPEAAELERWRAAGAGTKHLPPRLRPLWNERLKNRVVQRLRAWFEASGEPAPPDLLTLVPPDGDARPARPSHPTRAGSLRAFVTACVAGMTDAELEALPLPASAVHRYAERRTSAQ